MKVLDLPQLKRSASCKTDSLLLDVLLGEKVELPMVCGGRGLCATCHVHVIEGADSLSPPTDREKRTLARLSGSDHHSRLACQARVIGDGVRARVPDGRYIRDADDLEDLIGKRAKQPILHPVDGRILIQRGKIITRSAISGLRRVDFSITDIHTTDPGGR
jgi:ferredoxin